MESLTSLITCFIFQLSYLHIVIQISSMYLMSYYYLTYVHLRSKVA